MLVQYDLKTKQRRQLPLTYHFLQLPEGWMIKECKIHMNSLMLRQTGLVKEEVVILVESDNISAIRAIDFKLEEFEYNKTLQLEMQTCSIKFG